MDIRSFLCYVHFICIYLTCPVSTAQTLCGNTLANAVQSVCGDRGYYREISYSNENSPILRRRSALSFLSSREGTRTRRSWSRSGRIVEECCLQSCPRSTLESYCMPRRQSNPTQVTVTSFLSKNQISRTESEHLPEDYDAPVNNGATPSEGHQSQNVNSDISSSDLLPKNRLNSNLNSSRNVVTGLHNVDINETNAEESTGVNKKPGVGTGLEVAESSISIESESEHEAKSTNSNNGRTRPPSSNSGGRSRKKNRGRKNSRKTKNERKKKKKERNKNGGNSSRINNSSHRNRSSSLDENIPVTQQTNHQQGDNGQRQSRGKTNDSHIKGGKPASDPQDDVAKLQRQLNVIRSQLSSLDLLRDFDGLP